MSTAAELIAHLESGGLIARGEPDHAEFVWFEIYERNGVKHKHLGCYGWGSALGRVEDRLRSILYDPHEWVCIPAGASMTENKLVAQPLLESLGRHDNYDWELTVKDGRPANERN